jgi:hypothetical protein
LGSSMSRASNCLSSMISYFHYPRGQIGSGKINSPTGVRQELIAVSRRENLTSTSPKYACEVFYTHTHTHIHTHAHAIATFRFCRRLKVRTL